MERYKANTLCQHSEASNKTGLVEISIIDINIVQAINIGLSLSLVFCIMKSRSPPSTKTHAGFYPFATVLRCIGNTAYVCKIAWNDSLVWN